MYVKTEFLKEIPQVKWSHTAVFSPLADPRTAQM